LTLRLNADGSMTALDASGAQSFALPAPWMMETPGGNQRPGPPMPNVAVSLTGGGGHYQLTYTPDQAWLQDPARRYPVTLDPSITINYALGGEWDSLGYVQSPYATWCCGGWSPNYEYPIGYDGNGYIYRWVISFDGAYGFQDIRCSNCYATSASFHSYEYWDVGRGGGENLWLYQTTSQYWGSRPNVASIGTTGAYSHAVAPACNGGCTANISFDVTSIVQSWETTGSAGAGSFLMTGDEGACCNSIDMYAGSSGAPPYLVINYASDSITSPAPDPVVVQPGAIVSIPLQLTNTSGDYTWRASDQNDLIRIGVRQYQSSNGTWSGVNMPRTFLPYDVGPGGSVSTPIRIRSFWSDARHV